MNPFPTFWSIISDSGTAITDTNLLSHLLGLTADSAVERDGILLAHIYFRAVTIRASPPMVKTLFCQLLSVLALCFGCNNPALEPTKEAPMSSDKEYYNPVDQKTYVAKGGWRRYEAASPRPEIPPEIPGGKVKIGSVRLLMPEDDIAAQTTVVELATFTREAERLADETLGKSERPFTVLVQFDCTPSGHEVGLAYQGDVAKELLQEYYDALKAAKKLHVKNSKVSFQLELLVNQ